MKIKSLLLLGLATIFSMDALAAFTDTRDFRLSGVVYNLDDVARTAQIAGLTEGDVTSIEFPATITVDSKTYAVVEFSDTWKNGKSAAPASPKAKWYQTEAVTALTKITVNFDNFTKEPDATTFDIATLTELIFKGTSTIDGDVNLKAYGYSDKLATLDLSGLSAKSGKKVSIGTSYAAFTALTTVKLNGIDLVKDAFKGNTKIATVSGVKGVGQDAFNGCTGLTTVTLVEGATIAEGAFEGATALTTINMGVATEIGKNAFKK